MPSEDALLYRDYVKPELGRLMSALRLDVSYVRGRGEVLEWRDDAGEERKVLDFLGGYGASLFGHNRPELVETLLEALREERVFNAQKSCRSAAARLGEQLSARIGRATGRSYVTTFVNSGAEAVEVAIKHALFDYRARAATQQRAFERVTRKIVERYQRGDVKLSDTLCQEAAAQLPELECPADLEAIATALVARARASFSAEASFVGVSGAFHGLTVCALQLTADAKHRKPEGGLGLQVRRVTPDHESLREAQQASLHGYFGLRVSDGEVRLEPASWSDVAAIFVEPLQGEGGIVALPAAFLEAARRLATDNGYPLVFDEIQSGMGRTGTFLYAEQVGVRPDYVLLGKSLGGGLTKIGAVAIERALYHDAFSIAHSSTFAEDDLSALVALRGLALLDEHALPERCEQLGKYTVQRLCELRDRYPEVVEEVRGVGLMLGVKLRDFAQGDSLPLRTLCEQQMIGYLLSGHLLHEHGIRVGPTLSHAATIRIEPSAYVTEEQIDRLLVALESLFTLLRSGDVGSLTRYLLDRELQSRIELTSELPPSAERGAPQREAAAELDQLQQVAFVAHFANADDVVHWDSSFGRFPSEAREALLDRIHDVLEPVVHYRSALTSSTGKTLCMNVIGVCSDARLMSRYIRGSDRRLMLRQLERALELAEELNCTMVGLGGYNSIVAGNGLLLENPRVALTTGNSLTVAMGLSAIRQSAAMHGIDLRNARFAAVGAAGNIASIYSELMADEVPHVHLIGRDGSLARVEETAGRILRAAGEAALAYHRQLAGRPSGVGDQLLRKRSVTLLQQGMLALDDGALYRAFANELRSECPVTVGTDLGAIAHSDVVLSASNAPSYLITPEMIGEHPTVVCDISVPPDADPRIESMRPRCGVIQGGVIALPRDAEFHPPGSPLPAGRCYACLAETALLGFEDVREHFSYGAVTRERVQLSKRYADTHGFRLAETELHRRGYNLFSQNELKRVA